MNIRPGYDISLLSTQNLTLLSPYFMQNNSELTSLRFGKIILHNQQSYKLSSTDIRNNIKKHIYDANQLPQVVINYIKSHNLYS